MIENTGNWSFDKINTDTFNDYLNNQLPWYKDYLSSILPLIFSEYAVEKSTVYDLGASVGNTELINNSIILNRGLNFVPIEISDSMVENYQGDKSRLVQSSVLDCEYKDFNLLVSNLTLSFVKESKRLPFIDFLMSKCLVGGAILILDKMYSHNSDTQYLFTRLTQSIKQKTNDNEIVSKSLQLSGVQKPFTVKEQQFLEKNFECIFRFGEFAAYLYVNRG